MRRSGAVLILAAAAVAIGAVPAQAHALLSAAEPGEGQRLESAPSAVTLAFTEEPDAAASAVTVLDAAGKQVQQGKARAAGKSLSVGVGPLSDGVYTVTWRVLSRVDGHVTGGAYAFGVRADPSQAAPSQPTVQPAPSVLGVSGRVLFYAGGFLLLGAAVIFFAAGEQVRVTPTAAPAMLLGALLIAAAQAREAGIGVGDVLGSSIGDSLLRRALPLVLALVLLVLVKAARPRAIVAAAGAAGALLAHVIYGHAGAGDLRLPKIAVQWVHILAAGVWIGGLALLLVGFRRWAPEVRGRAARRYSALALVMFIVVAALGTVRAVDEVGSWSALTSTTFGKLVLGKVGLLVLLLIGGVVNRLRTVARAADAPGGLMAVGRAEIVVATVVLILTGMLSSVAPARSLAGPRERNVAASGEDFGRTVRVALEASPGGVGPNRFEAALTIPGSDDPYAADDVTLRFRFQGPQDVEPTQLVLSRTGDGRFAASGSNLALPGPWVVTAQIRKGTSVAEIPLTLATRTTQDQRVLPGEPPVYDTAFGDGRAQLYVAPGAAGRNEVHATFFDAQGKEWPIAEGGTLVATRAGQPPVRVPTRILTPGHFVADADLTAGTWRFDVFASDGEGDVLNAWFEQTVRK